MDYHSSSGSAKLSILIRSVLVLIMAVIGICAAMPSGDANGDGVTDQRDVEFIDSHLEANDGWFSETADMDMDGEITKWDRDTIHQMLQPLPVRSITWGYIKSVH